MELFSTITYTSAIFSDLSLVLRHLIKSIVYVSLILGASDFHFHKLISKSTSLWFGIHVLNVKSYYISIYQKLYSVLLFQWTRMFELQRALKLHQGGIARYCSFYYKYQIYRLLSISYFMTVLWRASVSNEEKWFARNEPTFLSIWSLLPEYLCKNLLM